MVRYRRWQTDNPDEIYFLTIVTKKRYNLFKPEDHYNLILNELNDIITFSNGNLNAFVLLPDHLHLLLTQGERSFSDIVKRFKRRISRQLDFKGGELWQDRFWEHKIREEIDYSNHADYIHYNPVHHGYVKSPSDWRYSSFIEYVNHGIYDKDWSSNIEIAGLSKGWE